MGIDFNYFGLNRHLKMDMDFRGHTLDVKEWITLSRGQKILAGVHFLCWIAIYVLYRIVYSLNNWGQVQKEVWIFDPRECKMGIEKLYILVRNRVRV